MRKTTEPKIPSRNGLASMELAVCLPIVLMLILGTIEACGMIYLKQTLCVAAYEGIRAAVLPGADAQDVRNRCDRVLSSRSVKGVLVSVDPPDFEKHPVQTWITVRVTANASQNAVVGSIYSDRLVIGAEATMMKEY